MAAPRVTVITLTYRRPEDLAQALPLLVDAIKDHAQAELLVVDNDEEPSAAEQVAAFLDSRVRYVHEPRPGIAAARNRGLDETRDRDVVVFIDDDERPCQGWLDHLLDAQTRFHAQAVAGPVSSEFESELDPWLRLGGYFDRLTPPTGVEREVAATNNLLLERRFVEEAGLRFDEKFGLSGGSDSVFTRQLRGAGGRLVWCAEAVVIDQVPASRANRSWVVRRSFRMGNTEARAKIYVAGNHLTALKERGLAAGRGTARLLAGATGFGLGMATFSTKLRSRGARRAARGAGMLSAAFGYTYFEYRRKPPQPL